MIVAEFGQKKVEPCKQADYKEKYKRVGKGKKKSGTEILPECVGRVIGFL